MKKLLTSYATPRQILAQASLTEHFKYTVLRCIELARAEELTLSNLGITGYSGTNLKFTSTQELAGVHLRIKLRPMPVHPVHGEDEKFLLQGIAQDAHGRKLGFSFAFLAYNREVAIEYFETRWVLELIDKLYYQKADELAGRI